MLTLSVSRLPARFDILAPMDREPTLTTQETASDRLNAACYPLLVAIARAEETALGALYDLTLSRVFGVALRIVGKSEAAEEVVADVFMQVWRNARNYDAVRSRPVTWLLMMTRSRALDHLRRRDEAESHPEPETLNLEAQSGDDDPMNILLAVERDTALAFFKGLSHQEIAEHTLIPLGTVKTHIRKALQILHHELALPAMKASS
jgi:RNA polymerase sigma factor (sigma-70 family)